MLLYIIIREGFRIYEFRTWERVSIFIIFYKYGYSYTSWASDGWGGDANKGSSTGWGSYSHPYNHDGWGEEDKGLTDEEIMKSKHYKKYQKKKKKIMKKLKKKLKVL